MCTVDSMAEQQQELTDSSVHLIPVEVEQRDHLEVELPQKVAQLIDISHWGSELPVVCVIHIPHQQCHLVCG